jgi:DNA-binding MarR family transcriptional regulator
LHYLSVGYYLRKVVDARMAASGLSLARTKVLEVLARRSPLSQSALAEALDQAPRSVTQSVEALEREGLVERSTSPDDRRSKLVALTPAGAKAVAAGSAAGQDVLRDIFGSIGAEDLALLDKLLNAIGTAVSAPALGLGGHCAALGSGVS